MQPELDTSLLVLRLQLLNLHHVLDRVLNVHQLDILIEPAFLHLRQSKDVFNIECQELT